MSALTRGHTLPPPSSRSAAGLALLGAALLAAPLAAHAGDAASAAQPGLHQAVAEASNMPGESVEQRIASLHKSLKITSGEESAWGGVAQTMRENAAAMQRLAADNTAAGPQSMTAVDDLKAYEAFAQAHVDGLKSLIASFDTLYATMPDHQKKIADQVFANFGRKPHPARS